MPLRVFALKTWLAKWLPAKFAPKSLGQRGEDFAARYLRRLGYQIVGRQIDLGVGELDIVAVDNRSAGGRTIVFVEVKTRTSDAAGLPAEAVDQERQTRLTRAALAYLKAHGLLEHRARFDVIALLWPDDAAAPTLEHIEDAFPAAGRGQFFN
jgi:putative endonuclease